MTFSHSGYNVVMDDQRETHRIAVKYAKILRFAKLSIRTSDINSQKTYNEERTVKQLINVRNNSRPTLPTSLLLLLLSHSLDILM